MGTPLKNLSALSPKIFSPLSPKFLSTLSSTQNGFLSPTNLDSTHHRGRKLDFFKSPGKSTNLGDIKLVVSTTKQILNQDILINTPIKKLISKNGLEKQKSLNVLGVGGFGRVIRAIHKGKTVAVKVVKSNTSFIREKNVLYLKHENILKVFDVVDNGNESYSMIIMEYFSESRQLQRVIEDSEINLEDKLVQFSVDITKGLNYCHSKGILHLDIKPQNIMVCRNKCKICDFGNSVKIENIGETFEHHGTIYYTSPEILQGKIPNTTSDIYSLGIVFWQLKSRKSPFSNCDNFQEVIYKVVKCNLRPDMEVKTDAYSKLYQQCWGRKPEDRPSTTRILELLYEM